MTVAEADELDRIKAAGALAADLRKAEERAKFLFVKCTV